MHRRYQCRNPRHNDYSLPYRARRIAVEYMRQKSAPCGDAATSTPAQRLVVETAVFSEPRSSRIRPKLLILLAVSVKLAKRTNVRVLNALGELRMDTAKPTCVLVPTAPPPTG